MNLYLVSLDFISAFYTIVMIVGFEGILKKEGKIAAFGYETGSGDQFHNVVL